MADAKRIGLWERLLQIDRRIIFVAVALSVSVPLFLDISQPIHVSAEVEDLYQSLEVLPSGSKILLACDYDPPSAPELQPMAIAIVTYCLERDLKMIVIGLWPQGPLQFNQALATVIGETPGDEFTYNGKTFRYGEDWVNLGFQEGREFVIQGMGSSFESMFPRDYSGKPYGEFPLLRGVTNFSNIDYVFNLSAGYPGTVEWVQLAGDRFHATIGAANTAVQAPMVYPYYRAGQLTGILGGMKGAAEFEKKVGIKGKATKFMLSQSSAHAIIILFIILGNIAYFVGGRRSRLKDKA